MLRSWVGECFRTPRTAIRSCLAFTLIELVIVIVIIGIFAGIAVPRYAGALARYHLDAATRRITVDLKLAQQLAKTKSQQHRIRFLANTNRYVLEVTTNGTNWDSVNDLDRTGQAYIVDLDEPPYRTMVVESMEGVDTEIVYDGYGRPASTMSLHIQVGKLERLLTTNADTGRVTVRRTTPGQVD